jgi:hypothetical protein
VFMSGHNGVKIILIGNEIGVIHLRVLDQVKLVNGETR